MTKPILILKQSAAEILAMAVVSLFPETELIGGGADEHGFYYDFLPKQPIDSHTIPLIEEKMRALIKAELPFKLMHMMRENGANFLQHHQQFFRGEIALQAGDNIVEIYQIENFYDYSPVPLATHSGEIASFKLVEIDRVHHYSPSEGEIEVLRLGGIISPSQMLKKRVKAAEIAKKRDHRVIGTEMGLFSSKEEAGVGHWFWHPKGVMLRQFLVDFWRSHLRQNGFQFIETPLVMRSKLAKEAGDVKGSNYLLEGESYQLRSSFIPLHMLYFADGLHSYKELPLKIAEIGELFIQKEQRELRGLLRSRAFLAEAAHTFCRSDQLEDQLISSLQFIDKIIKILGFECRWYLSSRGQKFAGTEENWDKGLDSLRNACRKAALRWEDDPFLNPFSGPSVESQVTDSLGRDWKGPKICLDFFSVEKFGLRYQGHDDEMHRPILIAIKIFSSIDQWIAMLIEHYNGYFPLWLAPEQVRILPIAERNIAYAEQIRETLVKETERVYIDARRELLKWKIHAAERERVPYMIVVGDKEEKTNKISLRIGSRNDQISELSLDELRITLKATSAGENK